MSRQYDILEHGMMIADRLRIDAYLESIRRAVQPGSVVADVGSGVGIFALAACRAGARRVYAIEPGAIVQVAREIVAANGFGGRSILPALLAKGAEINAADHDGRTALMNAAVDAQDDSVQLLLAHGADVNARTKNGLTAVKLVQAAKTQPGIPQLFVEHLDEIIAALRKAGATD